MLQDFDDNLPWVAVLKLVEKELLAIFVRSSTQKQPISRIDKFTV